MDGLTAVVTGADGTLGEAVARRFAADGARVVVSARDADELDELVADVEATDADDAGRVTGVRADVRDEYDVERLLELAARESDGGVDVVAACADAFHGDDGALDRADDASAGSDATETPLAEESYAAFDDTLRTNARGAFATIREAVPHLADDARVLVPAGSGERGRGGGSYAVSKAAAAAVARGFAAELDAAVGVVDARRLAADSEGIDRDSDLADAFAWAATEAAAEDVDGEVVGPDALESAEA